jgi:hypothetical protein
MCERYQGSGSVVVCLLFSTEGVCLAMFGGVEAQGSRDRWLELSTKRRASS